LGRGELIIIITSICTPERGRDGMDCIGVVWMTCSINSSHHQLGTCWRSNMPLGLLGSVFHSKNKYLSRYIRKNTFALELLRTEKNLISTQEHLGVSGGLWKTLRYSSVCRCSYMFLCNSQEVLGASRHTSIK